MSVWDSFYRLDYLDIGFYSNLSAKKATIYGNGKNQVELYFKVKILDKNNNPIDIPDEELINNIYLVNYIDGNKNINPWIQTSRKDDYVKVISWDVQSSDKPVEVYSGEKVLKYYLSVPTGNNGIDISAEIHIPGVGDFNTSSTGTATKNGPRGEVGSTFISPKFVHVNSIPAVDYTRSENFRIELGYEEYRNSFKWETRIDKDNNFTYQDNGKVWRQVVKLFPVKDMGNQTFKHCSINSDESTELKDGQISLGRVNWKELSYDGFKNGISGPGNADWMKIYPFAVIQSIKRGAKKNNTEVNVWFTPRKSNNYDFRLDGNFVLKDEKHTYLAFHKTTLLSHLNQQHRLN